MARRVNDGDYRRVGTLRRLGAFVQAQAVKLCKAAEPTAQATAKSDVKGCITAISERVETDPEGRWQLRDLWDEVERQADASGSGSSSADGRLRDVYAIYWRCRNAALFCAGIAGDDRVVLVYYADLVKEPKAAVGCVLAKTGMKPARIAFPQATWSEGRRSRERGALSPRVAEACDRLFEDLRSEAARCR